ncbi:efflux transporter outer membrane subunit [Paraburkholderia youngii]|uniref:efflux transporter outer membrane subunit n=1 Tax=Paraburkholderia youngii TaxID=2782701 RepID=UPI00159029A3|nr:efflux transporter outer membrane subunit [Paraburkholderia youngii]NUX59435.1 efflux transporter outer membrane subunit [Paraburkholderia youngii]
MRIRTATRVFTGTSCLLLAACMVGPNYRVPEQAMMNAPAARRAFLESSDPALSEAALPSYWWRLYSNPRLDALIEEALAANTNLRMANANLERSRALLREARTLRQPSVAVGGSVERAQLAGEQYLQSVTPPVSSYYETELTVGYDLDLFGGIRRGIEAAKADDEAVEAARDLVRVNVAAETARAYAGACGLGVQLSATRKSLALQRQSLELTKELRKHGRAIDLDVTRSQQLVDQLTTNIPALDAGRRNALYRLATLTGRPPSKFDADLENCEAPPRLTQPLPIGDGAALLKRRPDIREAERQLAAATAEIGVATAQLYPDIQIGFSAGSIGTTATAFTSPTNFWQLGSLIKWQVNQSAARAHIAAANASAKFALANFDGTVLAALADTESALNTYVHDLQREVSAEAARDDAATVERDAERLQAGGRATALTVIDAQRTLAAAEQSLAQLKSAISDDQVAVFLALGGGWESAPEVGSSARTP